MRLGAALLVPVFIAFGYFSAAAAPCEEFLSPVGGLKLYLDQLPINNPSALINVQERPLLVTRDRVSEVKLIDNRGVGLGINASLAPIFTSPEGYGIQGARARGVELFLHLSASEPVLWQRRNFLIRLDFAQDPFTTERLSHPWRWAKVWHIEEFVKASEPKAGWPLIRRISEWLDVDADVQHLGQFVVGPTSRYLGESEQPDAHYLYFAREHDLQITGEMSFEAMKRAMRAIQTKIMVVRIPFKAGERMKYIAIDIPGQIQISYVLPSTESPLRFFIQRLAPGSGFQQSRSPMGNQTLIELDLRGQEWNSF